MSQINIELVGFMGDDLTVSNTARVSFAKWKKEFDDKDARLIDYLAAHEHLSPFRHTAISLRCKAPVFLARQLGKHQAGLSWNEVSRRYVDVDIEFFVPDSWRSRPSDGIKQGSGDDVISHIPDHGMVDHPEYPVDKAYSELLKSCLYLYEGMLKGGVAPEMARMVLPQSMMVDFIWTGNLLSFFHVYRMRSGEGAQAEAREFAEKLKGVIQPLFPHCFEALERNG